jgi:ribonuclease D
VAELAAELKMPTENLLSPDSVRKLCWPEPPVDGNLESYIEQALAEAGARPWQISAVKERLEAPLRATEPLVASKPEGESVPEVE